LNSNWIAQRERVDAARTDFDEGIKELYQIFGTEIARKPDSSQFNRAIFDALIFYHSQPEIRKAVKSKRATVKKAYSELFAPGSEFARSIESDTAGTPNTQARLRIWGETLTKIAGTAIPVPNIASEIPAARSALRTVGAKRKPPC
jgi:hypothetical protein